MKRASWLRHFFLAYFDSHRLQMENVSEGDAGNAWRPAWPFIVLNLSVFFVFWVGVSPVAVAVALGLYIVRMWGITGGYHRYFSHRTYKTSRFFQFLIALLGNSAAQRGPLWWAAHHRHHHASSDTLEDPHSPAKTGFWNSHMLWWGRERNMPTRLELVKDLARFPELVFLDRFDALAPLVLGAGTYALGAVLAHWAPAYHTSGPQMLVWGFVVSTAVLFHGVATINSLSHVYGSRRFQTGDDSRNNFLLALLTLGEGWHNNHHHYPNTARQGFYWWEIDAAYYGLKSLGALGLVWDLKPVPQRILAEGRGELPISRVSSPPPARSFVYPPAAHARRQ